MLTSIASISRVVANKSSRRSPVSQDNKPQASESGGFLRRVFGLGGHETVGADARSGSAAKATLDLGDIQGFILRGYKMPMVRHFLLTVGVPAEARKLLGRFVNGNESDVPQITTAEDWHVGLEPGPGDNPADAPRRKPDYCLNLGITWPGLIALGVKERVPTLSFKSFGAFISGAAKRAKLVGDTSESDPQHWIGGFGRGGDHVLLTLHAMSPQAMTSYSDRLVALFAEGGAFREIWRADGMALMEVKDGEPVPTFKVHFGYTDGISVTTIRGGPERYPPDHQQPCEPWLFVLQDEAENYIVPEPRELGLNSSFAVFKMIKTDVVGFENFLQSNKDKIDPELLAAKICGRWRNGIPLMLSPETDSPSDGIPPEQLNNFEYVNADGSGDPRGLRCPVGAHMRRINPRGQPVTGQGQPGGSNNTHRLIRRGLPYGPPYDPSQPYDGIERGLFGYFINSSIENQYEFVLGHWVNDSEFAGAVRLPPKSKDPMIGTQDPAESIFVIPQAKGASPIKLTGFSSFVTTKGAAYCFLPSVTAIKFIAKLG
jgi:deferrochelatase/peroxidase EfeB